MKNQDMPANPHPPIDTGSGIIPSRTGETKREKAFWQVYSAMLSSVIFKDWDCDQISISAIEAVNAGFKALENNNE